MLEPRVSTRELIERRSRSRGATVGGRCSAFYGLTCRRSTTAVTRARRPQTEVWGFILSSLRDYDTSQ